jgi:copper chaperone CopZ
MTQKIQLSGLHCDACKKLTEKKIGKLSGVESVGVDLDTQVADVQTTRLITNEEINDALEGTNYKAV